MLERAAYHAVLEESLMTPISQQTDARHRIAFVYLGRNPAFGTFVLELALAAMSHKTIAPDFFVADKTELSDRLREAKVPAFALPINFRSTVAHAVLGFFHARRRIISRLQKTRPTAVVTLMPHIWSPLLARQIRKHGIIYATTIHDVEPHPGDPTARATRWLATDASRADVVFTLSRSVADLLGARRLAEQARIVQLFHPDIGGRPGVRARQAPQSDRPFRVLFFGRIMAYKGLTILVEAIEKLRAEGYRVELGVAGIGDINSLRSRLSAIGAEVIDRWIPADELTRLLAKYDAMACSHVEASQSGVAALAFANAMPVIGTPVGGLAEQVIDRKTGVLAADASSRALATAIKRLMCEPGLYSAITNNLTATAADRSMAQFLSRVVAALDLVPARDR